MVDKLQTFVEELKKQHHELLYENDKRNAELKNILRECNDVKEPDEERDQIFDCLHKVSLSRLFVRSPLIFALLYS